MKLLSKLFRTRQLVKRCLEETEAIRRQLTRLESASALPWEGETAWSPAVGNRAHTLLGLLSPVALDSTPKVRLGGDQDGGYVIPGDWARIGGMVSLGIGSENSFDLACAEKGIEVQAYDFSIPSLPISHPKIVWHREKIASVDCPAQKETSLGHALSRIQGNSPIGLKMDIEGHEYSALLACPVEQLERVLFLVGEFHGLTAAIASGQTQPLEDTFRKLRLGFEVVHLHANNAVGCRLCGGYLVPQHLEITWVNRKFYSFVESQELFPTPLDRPNQTGRADLFLGSFRHHGPFSVSRG